MTSLVKFLFIVSAILGLIYAGLATFALMVEPQKREIVITVPPERIGK